MPTKKEDITCPRCEAPNTWNANNPFRPFCSERCKLIDLGAWANEEHRIPAEPATPSQSSNEENDDES